MGFGDKLKGLRDQAQQAVAENKDKIQGAVQVVGEAANTKTHGRYATKIAKVGDKVEQSVEKIAQGDGPADSGEAAPFMSQPAQAASFASEPAPAASFAGEPAPAAPTMSEPAEAATPPKANEATTGFPDFE